MIRRFIVGFTSAIALACAGSAAASADILPVGTWQFNETTGVVAHDSSWRDDDGTLVNGAAWGAGRFGGAAVLDGSQSAVNIPDESVLEPASVTVSAWVKATAPAPYEYILAKGGSGCSAASYGLYTGRYGGIQFYVSSNQGMSFVDSPDGGTSLWNGAWHNVIGTYDGSTVRLYIDGTQVGTGAADTAPIGYGLPSSNDLEVGNYSGCSEPGFAGSIDQVRVFDRVLSPSEVRITVGASRMLPPQVPFDLVL